MKTTTTHYWLLRANIRHKCFACMYIFYAVLGGVFTSGCKNPCKELADKVCSCKGTLSEQHACQTNVSARKRFYEIERTENEQQCSDILESKTCTCKALDRNEIEKCGLTRAAPTQTDDQTNSE